MDEEKPSSHTGRICHMRPKKEPLTWEACIGEKCYFYNRCYDEERWLKLLKITKRRYLGMSIEELLMEMGRHEREDIDNNRESEN